MRRTNWIDIGDWVILEITSGLHLGGVELPVLDVVGEIVERLALLLHVLWVRRRRGGGAGVPPARGEATLGLPSARAPGKKTKIQWLTSKFSKEWDFFTRVYWGVHSGPLCSSFAPGPDAKVIISCDIQFLLAIHALSLMYISSR